MIAIESFDVDHYVVGHAEPVSRQKIIQVMQSLMER